MSCNAKKDPNGTWRIQYRWTDWTGTKKKSQKRGFKTKKEAEEWYAHFMLQQSSDPTMTLEDFWEIYKADMEKRLRKTTMKQKEYVMNDKVLPYFGKTPINEITAPMIRKWQGEMIEKGFKPTYLKTIHNQLSCIMNYAVNFYDLRSNPCHKAGSMGKSKADEPMYAYDENDMLIASGGTAGYCAISESNRSDYALEYIQAWLAHPYTEKIFQIQGSDFENGFTARGTFLLKKLPFVKLDFTDDKQKELYDNVIFMTRKIYELNHQMILHPDKKSKGVLENEKNKNILEIQKLIEKVYKQKF